MKCYSERRKNANVIPNYITKLMRTSIYYISYPFRRYSFAAISIIGFWLVTIATLYIFNISDDRGNQLLNVFKYGWNVGDLSAYEFNFGELVNLVSIDSKEGIRPGPLIPGVILITKIISGSYFLFALISIYVALWVASLSLDLIQEISSMLCGFNFSYSDYLKETKIIKKWMIIAIQVLPFGLNPIFIYYTVFPSTDIYFSLLVLIIIRIIHESPKFMLITYFLSLTCRPTGLFLLPGIGYSILSTKGKAYSRRTKFKYTFFSVIISVVFFYYYRGYATSNIYVSSEIFAGKSIWGFPDQVTGLKTFLGNLTDQSDLNFIAITNALSVTFITPLTKLISLSGVRPSFQTVFQAPELTENMQQYLFIHKPFIYGYIRLTWSAFMSLPGMVLMFIIAGITKNKRLTLLAIFIISFALLLSASVVLERYVLFATGINTGLLILTVIILYSSHLLLSEKH